MMYVDCFIKIAHYYIMLNEYFDSDSVCDLCFVFTYFIQLPSSAVKSQYLLVLFILSCRMVIL